MKYDKPYLKHEQAGWNAFSYFAPYQDQSKKSSTTKYNQYKCKICQLKNQQNKIITIFDTCTYLLTLYFLLQPTTLLNTYHIALQ